MGDENATADPTGEETTSSTKTLMPNSGNCEPMSLEPKSEKEVVASMFSTHSTKAAGSVVEEPEEADMEVQMETDAVNYVDFMEQNDNFDDEFDTQERPLSSTNPLSYSLATSPNTPLWAKILLPILCLGCHAIFYYGQTAPMWKLRTFAEIDAWANATDVRIVLLI